jgi:hypothetical protein
MHDLYKLFYNIVLIVINKKINKQINNSLSMTRKYNMGN